MAMPEICFMSLHICWETKGNDRLKSILQVGASVPSLISLPHALMHSWIRWSLIHVVVFFISFRHVSLPSCQSCILHVNHVSLPHESCLFLLKSCLLPIASSNDRTIMRVRHAYHIHQHTYENVKHRRANQPRLFTRAFDQTAVLTIIESIFDYKQASRDQRMHGDGFWVVSYSSLYEEDGGMWERVRTRTSYIPS